MTYNSAKLNGTADTNGYASEACFFEYGETSLYGQTAECEPPDIESETPHPVTARIHGLSPRTHYHYRLVLSAEARTVYGQDQEFETGPEPPEVTAVSPRAGFEEGGNHVEITGGRLGEATEVRFGGSSAAFTINSDSSITATVPAHAPGAVDVTVANAGGKSTTTPGDRYTYVGHGHAPTIIKLSAKKGPAAGGNQVTISGTSLVGVTSVRFGDADAAYGETSPETLVATAPPGATGKIEVTVTTPNGESGITKKAAYTYGAPTITSVSPGGQPLTEASQVTIAGSGFQPGAGATAFKFGKASATGVQCSSTSSCTLIAPASAGPGTIDVIATSAAKKSKRSAGDRFTYESPAVSAVEPNSGPRQGGTTVTVRGSGFAAGKSNTTFAFGKALAIDVQCPSASECTMLSPAVSNPGPVDVIATVAKTSSGAGPGDRYAYE